MSEDLLQPQHKPLKLVLRVGNSARTYIDSSTSKHDRGDYYIDDEPVYHRKKKKKHKSYKDSELIKRLHKKKLKALDEVVKAASPIPIEEIGITNTTSQDSWQSSSTLSSKPSSPISPKQLKLEEKDQTDLEASLQSSQLMSPSHPATLTEDELNISSVKDINGLSQSCKNVDNQMDVKNKVESKPKINKTPSKKESPLQQCLYMLLKILERKDPEGYFAYPVDDSIAPGYSEIIESPMDFSTIRKKIEENVYPTVPALRDDIKLMCNNAMTYNEPETIYYLAAKKLLAAAYKYLCKDKFHKYRRNYGYIDKLTPEQIGITGITPCAGARKCKPIKKPITTSGAAPNLSASVHAFSKEDYSALQQPNTPSNYIRTGEYHSFQDSSFISMDTSSTWDNGGVSHYTPGPINNSVYSRQLYNTSSDIYGGSADVYQDVEFVDEQDEEVVLRRAKKAALRARRALEASNPRGKLGFLRKQPDGSTTLAFVPSAPPEINESMTTLEPKYLTLADIEGTQLSVGTDTLWMPAQESKEKISAVQYLEQYGCFGNGGLGPFSSYAPYYDSTEANITKEESDMLARIYNDSLTTKSSGDVKNSISGVEGLAELSALFEADPSLSVEYALSLLRFGKPGEGQNGAEREEGNHNTLVTDCVDAILDGLSEGKHSRNKLFVENLLAKLQNPAATLNHEYAPEPNQIPSYSALDGDLYQLTRDIIQLDNVQKERLSSVPLKHLSLVPKPNERELNLAAEVREQLFGLASKTKPGYLVSNEGLHKALNINLTSTEPNTILII